MASGEGNVIRRAGRALGKLWTDIDAARAPLAPLSARPILILFSAAVLVLVTMLFSHRMFFIQQLAPSFDSRARLFPLYPTFWWSGITVLNYLLIPVLAIKLAGGRLREFGLTARGFWKHLPKYVGLYLAVVPLIIIVSRFDRFQQTYPLAPEAALNWANFAAFEAAYFLQFVALEFFFRGYLLFGLERHLGALSIPVMVIPYAMIHLGKPVPEALASIVAGTVLGTLALRTRTIAGGIFVHYAVALTMDIVALTQKGQLF